MNYSGGYSQLDRALHGLAFAGLGIQKVLADLEDTLYGRSVDGVDVDGPVFITSLPRAGTTLLLQLVASRPGFGTHTYRDMPFVLCPLLWDRLSRGFRRKSELHERAHGDGISVGYDSPEAFEEIVWKAFWPEHYRHDRIIPWRAGDANAEFEAFFSQHLRKVIALAASRTREPVTRYVSKNNANIARIGYLARLFPDACFVVPFRDPVQQVSSLLRQHLRFIEIHAEDPFNRRYMEWLGHFEFGSTLRPLDFDGWTSRAACRDPRHPDFWLTYWCEAFESVLEVLDQMDPPAKLTVLDYDQGCDQPSCLLARLADALGLEQVESLLFEAGRVRRASRSCEPLAGAGPALLQRASSIHERLRAAGSSTERR